MDVADRAAETVLGSPLVWKLIALLKAPLWCDVSVTVPDEPCGMLTVVADGVTIKVLAVLIVSGTLTRLVKAGVALGRVAVISKV